MSKSTEMTKVVINDCYGGFNLSDDAVREYLRRTGREWTEEATRFGMTMFSVVGDEPWYCRDIPRTDPVLVALVEEWGDRANGECASLKVVPVPKGTAYRIDEYDGYESVETRDDIDWSIA